MAGNIIQLYQDSSFTTPVKFETTDFTRVSRTTAVQEPQNYVVGNVTYVAQNMSANGMTNVQNYSEPIAQYQPGPPAVVPNLHDKIYYVKPNGKITINAYVEHRQGLNDKLVMSASFTVGTTVIGAANIGIDSTADPLPSLAMRFCTIKNEAGDVSYGIMMLTSDNSWQASWISTNFWDGTKATTTPAPSRNATPSGFAGGRNMPHEDHNPQAVSKNISVLSTSGNGIHVYELSPAQYQALQGEFWSTSFQKKFKDLKYNPKSGILACYKFPITSASKVNVTGINVCGIRMLEGTTVSAHRQNIIYVPENPNLFEFNFESLDKWSNSFLDCDPYVQATLLLPFVGQVPINVNYFVYGWVGVRYIFDLLTGNCLAEVYVQDLDGKKLLSGRYPGNAAYQVPITANDQGGFAALGSFLGAAEIAGGVIATAATGGATAPLAIGAISNGASQIAKGISNPHETSMIGTLPGNVSCLAGDLDIRVVFKFRNDLEMLDNDNRDMLLHMFGRSSGCYATVKNFTDRNANFVQGNISGDDIQGATEAEKNAIKAAFAGGVYL